MGRIRKRSIELWQKYAALTKPIEIQRIGVRFIIGFQSHHKQAI